MIIDFDAQTVTQIDKANGSHAEAGRSAGRRRGMEVTMESSGFSAAPIPDSVFAIPDGYRQAAK